LADLRRTAERSDAPEPWLGERITLLFCPSLPLALACSETFPRFRILALLLLLARVEIGHTLLLRPMPCGMPLVVFPPVGREAPAIWHAYFTASMGG
jgi:hypothetical protein